MCDWGCARLREGVGAIPRLSSAPAAAALAKPGVHRGDSNQDSRRDWCLLSPLNCSCLFSYLEVQANRC